MPEGGYAAPYHDLLAELRRRESAVREQQILVDKFVLNLLGSANLSPEREAPKRKRNGNQFIPGFVIDAVNALTVEHHHLNGKIKLKEP